MLIGIVFNRTPFFRGKDNYDQLRKIAEVMGSEELDKYIAKYNLKLDKETLRLLGRYKHHDWQEYVHETTKKFICDELFDYLNKTLVYDHNVGFVDVVNYVIDNSLWMTGDDLIDEYLMNRIV